MRVDIHTFPFGTSTPVYGGYIEMEEFDADKCWELCNWTEWTDKKPNGLYSEIGSCSHAICFTNTETEEKWLALSFGWLAGNSLKISDYVERHKNDILWQKEYVLVSQGVEIYRTTNKEEAKKIQEESNRIWRKYVEMYIEECELYVDNEVFLYEENGNEATLLPEF